MAHRRGGSLISTIRQLSHRIFWAMLRERGMGDLSPEQGKILFALMEAPEGLTIREIGQKTNLKKSTLTTMLRRMETNGYLTMAGDALDGRATRVHRTQKFTRQMDDYDVVSRQMTDVYYKGFREEEIDIFESMLNRILQNLKEYENTKREEEL
jgi:DNA-binding MarR family transcriptional regulator